jgi:hypothetical protein
MVMTLGGVLYLGACQLLGVNMMTQLRPRRKKAE